jgi:hypothetical protein
MPMKLNISHMCSNGLRLESLTSWVYTRIRQRPAYGDTNDTVHLKGIPSFTLKFIRTRGFVGLIPEHYAARVGGWGV